MNNSKFTKGPGPRPGPDFSLVRTRTIRMRNGRVLKAENYGLRCFVFWARPRK